MVTHSQVVMVTQSQVVMVTHSQVVMVTHSQVVMVTQSQVVMVTQSQVAVVKKLHTETSAHLGLPLYVTMMLIVFLARISSDCLTEKRELSTDRRKVVGVGNTFLN